MRQRNRPFAAIAILSMALILGAYQTLPTNTFMGSLLRLYVDMASTPRV